MKQSNGKFLVRLANPLTPTKLPQTPQRKKKTPSKKTPHEKYPLNAWTTTTRTIDGIKRRVWIRRREVDGKSKYDVRLTPPALWKKAMTRHLLERYPEAAIPDSETTAKEVLELTEENFTRWAHNPGVVDLRGIDTAFNDSSREELIAAAKFLGMKTVAGDEPKEKLIDNIKQCLRERRSATHPTETKPPRPKPKHEAKPKQTSSAPTNWSDKKTTELRELAQKRNIYGRSKMNKQELVAALANPEAHQPPPRRIKRRGKPTGRPMNLALQETVIEQMYYKEHGGDLPDDWDSWLDPKLTLQENYASIHDNLMMQYEEERIALEDMY